MSTTSFGRTSERPVPVPGSRGDGRLSGTTSRRFRCADCGRTWADVEEAFQHVMAFGPAERAAKLA